MHNRGMYVVYQFMYQDKQLMYDLALEMLKTDHIFRNFLISLICNSSTCASMVVEFKPVSGSQMHTTPFEVACINTLYSDPKRDDINHLEKILEQNRLEAVIAYADGNSGILILPNHLYQSFFKYPGIAQLSCSGIDEQKHEFFKCIGENILKNLQRNYQKKMWISSNLVSRSLSSLVYMHISMDENNILHTPYTSRGDYLLW